MLTDETAIHRWKIEPRESRTKRAEKTLDAAMEATDPPRKWYGGTAPRPADAFKQYEKKLGEAMKGMTNDDIEALRTAAANRAKTMAPAANAGDPRAAADRRLMHGITNTATATAAHRENRSVDDLDRLTSLRDPALQRKAVAGMDPDRLRLLNRRANDMGDPNANQLDAATRRACNTVHGAASARIGDISGHSGKASDRIPSVKEKQQRLANDMTTRDQENYLQEATPDERKSIKAALSSELKTAREGDRKKITRALDTTQRAIDEGPGFRGLQKPFATKTHDRKSEQCVTRGAGRPAGGAMPTPAPARGRVEQAAAR